MIGTPHVHHRLADSTNERAKALAAAGAPHGTLITAAEQTAGRGRQGRSWLAEAGAAVLMSVVLRPPPEALPLAAAVAVAEAVPAETAIKWPNDVLVGGRKLAGILVEGRPQEGWVVLGIGLNVSGIPEEVGDIAASLEGAERDEVLAALLERLEARLSSPLEEVLDEWRRRDALLGQEIAWDGGSGVAAGIDSDGALLVDTDDGRVALVAGEVHLTRH
jgi:BirA family biotin operon repressor/biotin-[acetyl-CoA-carboxylase] ligase